LVRDHLGGGTQRWVSVHETVCTNPECEGPATEIRIATLGFREIGALIPTQTSDFGPSDVAAVI